MARDITAAVITATGAEVVRPVLMAALDLDDGVIRVNGSDRDVVYGAYTYYGVGYLGKVSAVNESSELQANGITLTLSGIPARFITVLLSEHFQGRTVTVYQGFLNDSYALIADPVVQFAGFIDQARLNLGETVTIELTCEHKLARWETPNVRRYTDADQQQAFPGDLGCQYVAQVVEKEPIWGRRT